MTKICIRCKEEKSISEFNKRTNSNDGMDYYCKACKKILKREEYLRNREKYIERANVWGNNNYERKINNMREYQAKNKEALLQQKRDYRKENHDLVRAQAKACRERNKEVFKARCREHYHKNKHTGAWQVYSEIRRARKAGIPGSFTLQEVENLLQSQFCKCAYCGTSLEEGYHADHLIPIARPELGSTNYISNIQLTCPECNLSKKDKLNDEFIHYLQVTDLPKYEKYLKHQEYIATRILLQDWRL